MLVLLLAVSSPVAAQLFDPSLSLSPAGGPLLSLSLQDVELTECGSCRLQRVSLIDEPGAAASDGPLVRPETPWRRTLSAALIAASVPASTAFNSLVGYSLRDFHFVDDGFFGAQTPEGGADKASHFVDYYIASREISLAFEMLGYPESKARWMGLGVALLGGLVNEFCDGFTRHGFSYGDLVMDALGGGAATLVLMTRTDDLVGFRTSHVPGSTYAHDVYSMDLKLAGLARRLGLNVGPFRYLLFSVTYGAKGYPDKSPEEQQRQVGLEIGLNLEEMLNAVTVRRDTWWGYALHLVVDNVRFPYTAIGMRYDLNHRKWHGPNNGNFP